jgi:hypothetical protein
MVREIREDTPRLLDAVADRRTGVLDELGRDDGRADPPRSRGVSRNSSREGTFRRCTGKYGGEKEGAKRSSRLRRGAGGPQMRNSTDGSQNGEKNRSPSM